MRRSPRNTPKSSQTSSTGQQPSQTQNILVDQVSLPNNTQSSIQRPASALPDLNDILANTLPNAATVPNSINASQNITPSASNAGNVQPNSSVNITLTQGQFMDLLGGLNIRQEPRSTFANCSARFSGGSNTTKVEDFIATILVYKDAEHVSDFLALTSLPLLLEGYASTWWQGVKDEAMTFEMAIDLLRKAFSPPKPDWRIFAELNQEKQKSFESTDGFICRKRRLFAQLSELLSEKTMLNIIFSQLLISI